MNKKELVASVADMAEVSKSEVSEILDALLETITEVLADGDTVDLYGFGKFSVTERAARKGRNPSTGETIQIAASKSPKFKPSKGFKETIKAS